MNIKKRNKLNKMNINKLIHKTNKNLFFLLVSIPFLLTTVYVVFIAQERYISTSQVTVKRPEDAAANALSIGLLIGSSNHSSTEDVLYLKDYILSQAMLQTVDKQLNLHKEYANAGLDWFNTLPKDTTKEAFLRYFRERIHLNYDEKTGLLSIETQGFTPEFALNLNQAILKESERFINELSHKIVYEQMKFAVQEVQTAYEKLTESKKAILNYQNQYGLLDPISQAEAASRMIIEMQTQKVQLETQLRNQLTYLKNNTPQVVSTRNALDSLNKQIGEEKSKIAAPQGVQLNSLAAQFLLLKGQLEFDTKIYETAMAAAEKTRMETARKLKVLSVVISPQLAEEYEYPHRAYIISSILLACLLLFGIARLILSVIEDHRD